MLSYICGNDCVSIGKLIKLFNNVRSGQLTVIIRKWIFCFHFLNMLDPLRMWNILRKFLKNTAKGFSYISYNRGIYLNVLIDLSGIYIQLKDLCLFRKCFGITCDTIAEPGSQNDQKIALCYTQVRCLGSMHSQHTCIKRILTGKAPLPIRLSQTGA